MMGWSRGIEKMGNRKGTERSGAEGEKRKEGNWAVDRGRGQSREKEMHRRKKSPLLKVVE